jgi:hypothetical protein
MAKITSWVRSKMCSFLWMFRLCTEALPLICILPANPPKERADERTRTADLISLRVIGQALQECAGACKSRISKPVSFLCFVLCCTVLRSRGYQNGIKRSLVN